MADVFKSFATEEEYNNSLNEVKQGFLTELGFDNVEALHAKLNANPDETLTNENEQLKEQLAQEQANATKALTELKRDISGKLGINLFDEKELETYLEGIKTTNEAINSLKESNAQLAAEKDAIDIENNLLKVGIQSKRIERATAIILTDVANGKSVKDAVDALVKEFPEWVGGAGTVGADLNPDNTNLTGREKYYKEQGYIK